MALPDVAHRVIGWFSTTRFDLAAAAYPGYRVYRKRSPIHIPILRLEPR